MKGIHNLLDTNRLLNVRNGLSDNKSILTQILMERVEPLERFSSIRILSDNGDVKHLFNIPLASIIVEEQ